MLTNSTSMYCTARLNPSAFVVTFLLISHWSCTCFIARSKVQTLLQVHITDCHESFCLNFVLSVTHFDFSTRFDRKLEEKMKQEGRGNENVKREENWKEEKR